MTSDRVLADIVQTIDQLGPPKRRVNAGVNEDGTPWDPTIGKCACQKMVPLSNFRVYNTGLINAVDNVCPGCRHGLEKYAIIVCARCRAVVARIEPHKDKTGFVFEPGRSYHLDCCAICEPQVVVERSEPTFILEMLTFMKMNGQPIPDQWKNRKHQTPIIIQST
jgi:hypothetical protein